ncbi:hypothetical protein [Saccharothrix deserti]|uniref:hypothetical protein n=1 Tax=Saccharothrix deserti TaxID=2593674 RepID=UPI00131C005C|nr:hypothetical protein [Saccharothrix deserti]
MAHPGLRSLPRLRDWCLARRDCAFEVDRVIDDLLAEAAERPLPAPSAGAGKTVDLTQLRVGVNSGLSRSASGRPPR